jgi:hypothetical protein
MLIGTRIDGRPLVFTQFSTDDFGDEVMAVSALNDEINRFQIVMNPETYWHIFELSWKVRDWQDGHDAE